MSDSFVAQNPCIRAPSIRVKAPCLSFWA